MYNIVCNIFIAQSWSTQWDILYISILCIIKIIIPLFSCHSPEADLISSPFCASSLPTMPSGTSVLPSVHSPGLQSQRKTISLVFTLVFAFLVSSRFWNPIQFDPWSNYARLKQSQRAKTNLILLMKNTPDQKWSQMSYKVNSGKSYLQLALTYPNNSPSLWRTDAWWKQLLELCPADLIYQIFQRTLSWVQCLLMIII